VDEALRDKLDRLARNAGVYVFRDRAGGVLYVGKASSLRNRVRSYFQPGTSDERYFIPGLAAEIGDLETVVCASEKEAALLENLLIKEHKPALQREAPRRQGVPVAAPRAERAVASARVVRRPRADGAWYFGPYHSGDGRAAGRCAW